MNIVSRLIDASYDFEVAGRARRKIVVSEAGRKALADYEEDFWRGFVTDEFKNRRKDFDFTKFILGVPVECDPAQKDEFVIQ